MVDFFLGAEIIQDVCLGELRERGDFRSGCALKTLFGKAFFRGVQNLLNSRAAQAAGRALRRI